MDRGGVDPCRLAPQVGAGYDAGSGRTERASWIA